MTIEQAEAEYTRLIPKWTTPTKETTMKRVYVAGLYSRTADGGKANVIQVLDNIRAGQAASLKVLRMGFAVFCPWLDYQFHLLDDEPIPVELYKANSMAWVEVSDYVVVISGDGLGSGVDAEIERARELGIPVYYSINEFKNRDEQDGGV